MKTKISLLALALSAAIGGQAHAAGEIEWVPGKTKVANGDLVIYQGECYQAKNNPGTWETPSAASSWFWTPQACSGVEPTPTPTPSVEPTPAPSIEPTTAPTVAPTPVPGNEIPWVPGKTKVNNGDVVIHNGVCYEAKNNPGTWETPSTSNWFWTEVPCSGVQPTVEPTV
ncbi:hypothetical protein K1M91_13400, partial [Motilimonas sp. E26]|nr:hypothetical protein [Motilimonas sp. E26]